MVSLLGRKVGVVKFLYFVMDLLFSFVILSLIGDEDFVFYYNESV